MSASFLGALPSRPNSYRWYYADIATPELSAVAIFMLGAPFSAAYSARHARGAHPLDHSAVNFVLYRKGQRAVWVLSEYPGARQRDGVLSIGNSSLALENGGVRLRIDERRAPWGKRVVAELTLEPEFPGLEPQQLVPGEPHFWQPLLPRAQASLVLGNAESPDGAEPERHEGVGYFDSNWGEEPLGKRVEGWRWTRVHSEAQTQIWYHPPHTSSLHVRARADGAQLSRAADGDGSAEGNVVTTRWRLPVPRELPLASAGLGRARLLESSPFYARLEAHGEGSHAMSEVADFRRFHSPLIRWMAHFRTRKEAAR